jgi:hypothetical protein
MSKDWPIGRLGDLSKTVMNGSAASLAAPINPASPVTLSDEGHRKDSRRFQADSNNYDSFRN